MACYQPKATGERRSTAPCNCCLKGLSFQWRFIPAVNPILEPGTLISPVPVREPGGVGICSAGDCRLPDFVFVALMEIGAAVTSSSPGVKSKCWVLPGKLGQRKKGKADYSEGLAVLILMTWGLLYCNSWSTQEDFHPKSSMYQLIAPGWGGKS